MTTSVNSLKQAVESNDLGQIESNKILFLQAAKDPISQWLDKANGSSVTDNEIFMTLPRFWEKEFQNDMKALNVQF